MMLTVSEKVRVLLDRKKMTVGDLADRLGVTRQNLSNKLTRNNFAENDIAKLADALNCDFEIRFTDRDTNDFI
ncbi:helix-turn-helix transcriptional regulator [Blautia sp. NSJ-34]|uniref:XRE family transcriptional regulator n=4 Tax=root TaxID=1 RepID=A0A7G5N0Z9_9FIRM|nr:helix-turn-helix transcriptional regulator [Blautia celeris]QIB58720.1 helix-turn-helix transcriptional regulator [Blautia producta ATCC 27340 = DSM 2950]QMW80542.1 XRE family transcriptional regulator [Blautia producta]